MNGAAPKKGAFTDQASALAHGSANKTVVPVKMWIAQNIIDEKYKLEPNKMINVYFHSTARNALGPNKKRLEAAIEKGIEFLMGEGEPCGKYISRSYLNELKRKDIDSVLTTKVIDLDDPRYDQVVGNDNDPGETKFVLMGRTSEDEPVLDKILPEWSLFIDIMCGRYPDVRKISFEALEKNLKPGGWGAAGPYQRIVLAAVSLENVVQFATPAFGFTLGIFNSPINEENKRYYRCMMDKMANSIAFTPSQREREFKPDFERVGSLNISPGVKQLMEDYSLTIEDIETAWNPVENGDTVTRIKLITITEKKLKALLLDRVLDILAEFAHILHTRADLSDIKVDNSAPKTTTETPMGFRGKDAEFITAEVNNTAKKLKKYNFYSGNGYFMFKNLRGDGSAPNPNPEQPCL